MKLKIISNKTYFILEEDILKNGVFPFGKEGMDRDSYPENIGTLKPI